MGKKTLFLSHLCLFLPKKRAFLPKKCVFFPKKRLFIRNKRKNRVKKGCFWPKNAQNNRFISSEEKGISSEVIAISSEEIGFPSEEKGISSEFGEQRKEKKYISIYIFHSPSTSSSRAHMRVYCAYAHKRVGMYAHTCRQAKENLQRKFLAGRKKINLGLPSAGLSLWAKKRISHEKIA